MRSPGEPGSKRVLRVAFPWGVLAAEGGARGVNGKQTAWRKFFDGAERWHGGGKTADLEAGGRVERRVEAKSDSEAG